VQNLGQRILDLSLALGIAQFVAQKGVGKRDHDLVPPHFDRFAS
jgi:hypothetical protein